MELGRGILLFVVNNGNKLASVSDTPQAVTFTALKAGTSPITYTVNGQSVSYKVTIAEAVLPETGQSFTWVWLLGGLAILILGAAVFIVLRKKRSRT